LQPIISPTKTLSTAENVRWLADECVAAPLVASLRAAGHDVLYVAEVAAGFSDADVIALALHEKRLLLTEEGFR
jgi:hypothetical protein